ncbi:MAG: POTRA domain-containing protein [Pigmentiphaga sp.]
MIMKRACLPFLVLAAFPFYSAAQTPPAINPIPGNPVDTITPRPVPSAPPPIPIAAPPTPRDQALKHLLSHTLTPRVFDVSGVTAVPFEDVIAILEPLAGRAMTLGALIDEVNRITALYQQRGFLLSFALIQAQDFKDGLIKVTVVEGHVGQTLLQGQPGPIAKQIRAYTRHIEAEKPLTKATLERYLNLISNTYGVTVQPTLAMPKREDGAAELALNISRKPVALEGGISNLGTSTHGMLTARTQSLTALAEQVQVSVAVPRGSEKLHYAAASAAVPLNSHGLEIKLDGFHYDAHPRSTYLDALGIDRQVRNQRIGLSLSYPFLLSNQQRLAGTLGIYGLNSRDRYTGRQTGLSIGSDTTLRVAKAELSYSRSQQRWTQRWTGFAHAGIDGLGAKQSTRGLSESDLDFYRLGLSTQHSVLLPQQFGLSLSALLQYSPHQLASAEQVTFGSQRFGLGYPAGELGGDKGWGLSAELNRKLFISTGWLQVLQPYLTLDHARIGLNRANTGLLKRQISSAALGLRFSDQKHYALDINVAKPIGPAPNEKPDRPWRLNASYSFKFD